MSVQVTIDAAELDRLIARVALIVSEQVIASIQRGSVAPTTPAVTPVASIEEHRAARPIETARAAPRDIGITARQREILDGWRNRRALHDAIRAIVGHDVDVAGLSKYQASRILDELMPARAGGELR